MTGSATAAARLTHGDHTVSFCSTGCRDAFAADPDRYLTNTEHRHL